MHKPVRATDFERLYDDEAESLFGFLAYRTGDRALAEDLVAETFEAAFKARHRFDRRRASPRTWLYTIALNRLRDHARHGAAEGRAMDRAAIEPRPWISGGNDPGSTAVEERDRLSRALATLSDEERECVALRFGGDLTLKEIAAATGQPMTTVEGRVYRALRKLRAELE